LAFSIPEPFGGLPFARRRSSLSISHLSLFYFSAPAVYLLSPPVPFFIGNTAQFPPCGLSTAPADAVPRSPYRHLELYGIAHSFLLRNALTKALIFSYNKKVVAQ
jgi:hypothetical protein